MLCLHLLLLLGLFFLTLLLVLEMGLADAVSSSSPASRSFLSDFVAGVRDGFGRRCVFIFSCFSVFSF